MSVFNDESLNKLKEVADASQTVKDRPFFCNGSQIKALLARLEAAEKALAKADCLCGEQGWTDGKDCECGFLKLKEVHRKLAGWV